MIGIRVNNNFERRTDRKKIIEKYDFLNSIVLSLKLWLHT